MLPGPSASCTAPVCWQFNPSFERLEAPRLHGGPHPGSRRIRETSAVAPNLPVETVDTFAGRIRRPHPLPHRISAAQRLAAIVQRLEHVGNVREVEGELNRRAARTDQQQPGSLELL